jgi:transposase
MMGADPDRFGGRSTVVLIKPVYQPGPDIASNPRLLPALFAEHEEQTARTFDVHRHRDRSKEIPMDTMYRCCAGLDVHKETVAACVRRVDSAGRITQEVRTFGTTTGQLLTLCDHLVSQGAEAAAMESTGVFWKPLWNILEGSLKVILVNARHIKNVPGRKTDVKDCQWIAQLLQHGLLRASFVPERPQREWRDLTRQRSRLTAEQSRVSNRIHKTLEDANIKLSSVATDLLGVSGREMIRALISGQEDPAALAELARRKLRSKLPQLREALRGHPTEHHRFMLRQLMDHRDYLDRQIGAFEQRIEELMRPFAQQIQRLETIPGVGTRTAQNVLAEIGTDMSRFPTAQHLASWAAMCPGNRESAGKRQSGHTNHGNSWLRTALAQAAWAASHSKNTYLAAQYRRLAGRRGKKRAIVAVGHTMLVMMYHLLKDNVDYHDLGHDYLDKLQPRRLTHYLVKRLEGLGHKVTLTPVDQAA